MNRRSRLSRDRFYRCFSACLALSTALLLVPADWIKINRTRREPVEPEPREIEIVRLPPEEIPPPPPLPERPKPEKKRPKPRPKPPEPEPEPQLEPMFEEPEIEIPRQRLQKLEQALPQEMARAEVRRELDEPELDVPRPERQQTQTLEVVADDRPDRIDRIDEPVEITVPKEVPRSANEPRVEVAAATQESFHQADAPDVNVVTSRPAARKSDRSSLQPVSRRLKTGMRASDAQNAPDVDMPTGNTSAPSHRSAIAVSGPVEGTNVTYDANPGDAHQVAVASPDRSSRSGAAPKLAVTEGGASGLAYSAAPEEVGVGAVGGSRAGGGRATKLGQVAAGLSRKYGLPLIRVSDLGRRSTDAARWNVLLPQISDLVREGRNKRNWEAAAGHNVRSVTRDGDALIIRYKDGVIHVLVPTPDGLTAMYVSASSNARPVVSKVEEAEQAKKALTLYVRGAS